MTEAIVIALITAAAAVISNALITSSARKKDAVERARLDERTAMRLDRIERKLDEHNGYADRINAIQRDIAVIATKIEDGK